MILCLNASPVKSVLDIGTSSGVFTEALDEKAEEFRQNNRITRLPSPGREDEASNDALPQPDPVHAVPSTSQQQPFLFENVEDRPGKSDVLQYYPDLIASGAKRCSG